MAAKSFFKRQLELALLEISLPITSTKVKLAFKACKKTIPKSQILYHWKKLNP
jgi:hypothetical protein